VALVDVISDQVNQECCAERREVGDVTDRLVVHVATHNVIDGSDD
jgi:hypothetical protein